MSQWICLTSKSIILFVNVLHVEGGLIVFLKQDILNLLFASANQLWDMSLYRSFETSLSCWKVFQFFTCDVGDLPKCFHK